ncbi:MAG: tRNA lysidine(34) synthetase TilS [Flavobacterium sp.]
MTFNFRLSNHLSSNFPFLKGKRLLLAVSGGLDSMVMTHLFQRSGYEIALAHCNFQLRGEESEGDQLFIEQYSQENKIPLFVTRFDTKIYAENNKLSTQLAARELRYNWFQEILDENKYDFLLTAHHADDSLETFLINLTRGTGLEGLTGIPAQNSQIIRPLLVFSREEIIKYARENSLLWREDSSNASDKYLRNKIRHDLIPVLKELNPNFLDSFQKTQEYLQESQSLVQDAARLVYNQVVEEKNDEIYFDINKLKKQNNFRFYLYQWLHPYGFRAWEDIYNLVESQSGKQVFSDEYRLLKDRSNLILSKKTVCTEEKEYFIFENQQEILKPLNISLSESNSYANDSNMSIFVDRKKIIFPLILRKWREGDVFQPSGMGGKSKKVSKFFKDQKMSLLEKEQTWLLCSDSKVVWVVGIRQDERFKANNLTENILQITLLK